MSRSLPIHYILETTFAPIFLSIFRTNPSAEDSQLHKVTSIYAICIHCFCYFLSSFDNNFIMIGRSKQCTRSQRTRGGLKIERYAQSLTHRACMGRGKFLLMGSYWGKLGEVTLPPFPSTLVRFCRLRGNSNASKVCCLTKRTSFGFITTSWESAPWLKVPPQDLDMLIFCCFVHRI